MEVKGRGAAVRLWLCLIALAAFAIPASAYAANPEEIGEFGESGSGAGQFIEARAMAADPATGHVFVVDTRTTGPTNRIDEFTAWGEFVKSWGWGVRDGVSELQTCGPGAEPPSTTCQPGAAGAEPGQLQAPAGIAMDSAGDLYVFERLNARVQKFSPDGEFLLMFGGEVNKSTGADVCTSADVEGGDTCGAGIAGTGDSEFSIENVLGVDGDYITVGPDDTIYVADRNRIQKFSPDGSFGGAIALPQTGNPGAMDIDPVSEDLYFAYRQTSSSQTPNVFRLDSDTGAVVDELPVAVPRGIATDTAGNVFVVEDVTILPNHPEVIEFAPDGTPLIPAGSNFALTSFKFGGFREPIRAIATNTVTQAGEIALYVSSDNEASKARIKFYGVAPDKWPPPMKAPSIGGQFASAVGSTQAVVKAEINPRFWSDTRYYVEYGTSQCHEGGCTAQPAPPGDLLGAGIVNRTIITAGIQLQGLQPNTTYFIRFVAVSGGGGPTVGGEGTEAEGSFTTFPSQAAPNFDCSNQEFRVDAGAFLPDCRAYEMVSPVDKNNADIAVQCNNVCFAARLDQAAAGGDKFTYSAYRAFADQVSAPYSSQYMSTRTDQGWVTDGINPPREGAPKLSSVGLDVQYRAFSDDLSEGWLLQSTDPLLAPGAIAEYQNLYHRDNVSEVYETLTTLKPVDTVPAEFLVQLQGLSADNSHVVFRANGKLTANAASKGLMQTYEYFEGQLRLVSIRPNGVVNTEGSSAGSATLGGIDREAAVEHAISDDGSRIFWTEAGSGSGRIYVRIDGKETKLVSNKPAEFLTASADGHNVFFRLSGVEQKMVRYNVDSGEETTIAQHVLGVAGSSEDASRIYFASTDALAPGGTAEAPNLYLYEDDSGIAFVASLASADVSEISRYNPVSQKPVFRTSQVTPDGRVILFMTQASPTGFDNTEAGNGNPVTEVYRYDADSEALTCISCNPTGARPSGQILRERGGLPTETWSAGAIPPGESQLFRPRALSSSGERAFFESSDRLVLRDTNGQRDVYEWESVGTGNCTSQSIDFSTDADGCVSLISSGQSPSGSEFIDATPSGSEVFFGTLSSLVSQDPGNVDIYSARIEGGFPPPPPPPPICQGESCQPAAEAPPVPPPPSSQSFVGPSDPKPFRCPKGKRRVKKNGHYRCVKKNHHKKKHHKRNQRKQGVNS